MQIHQVLVRPSDNTAIILYVDAVGNRNSIVLDTAGNANVNAFILQCQQLLPPDTSNPAKAEIEREIDALEVRITQLKAAIGIP